MTSENSAAARWYGSGGWIRWERVLRVKHKLRPEQICDQAGATVSVSVNIPAQGDELRQMLIPFMFFGHVGVQKRFQDSIRGVTSSDGILGLR